MAISHEAVQDDPAQVADNMETDSLDNIDKPFLLSFLPKI
jgi:hypothetical protein